jgi:glycosyltransferase involved in cell wall biosynthesis
VLRRGVNAVVRYDPLMRLTYRRARSVYFTSPAHLARVPGFVRDKAQVELAIGVSGEAPSPFGKVYQGKRLVFVGRAIGWKGMDLGMAAFARALVVRPDLHLTVIGDGPDKARWMAKAASLGVAHAIEWAGWLSKGEVQRRYADFDVLFYPSLRDSGGFVVLEALEAGLPVVCFQLGGPGVMVDASAGEAVAALPDVDQTVTAFAAAVLRVLARTHTEPGLAQACADRARNFSWPALCDRVLARELPPEETQA